MPFVKLDTGIINSTLWIERDCRDVFITALLMAQPRELTEPMKQISIRTLEETGFEVPVGWYGFVPAAGIGIIRQALVETEAGLNSLERLGSPDRESRSPEFEGRRMVRVDGGFVILNFIKYREKDSSSSERSKRWRERKKQLATRVSDTPQRVIRHQAEAEAEALSTANPVVAQESFTLDAAVSFVLVEGGLAGRELRTVIHQLIARDIKKLGVEPKNCAEAMVASWQKYEAMDLAFKYGPEKFFGTGTWRKSEKEWRGSQTQTSPQNVDAKYVPESEKRKRELADRKAAGL